ncbi:DUF3606 domain-containing protein [Afipia sp. DC4300-2b1]|uniref:DUF3606 domain-containing protein n=1 Tax=Afipia sp. DC4300-2b1 TaxID=2804672 RepID=UPI003CF9D04D
MENLAKKVQADRRRINLSEHFEQKYWTKSFGVNGKQLEGGVEKVGNTASRSARNQIL